MWKRKGEKVRQLLVPSSVDLLGSSRQLTILFRRSLSLFFSSYQPYRSPSSALNLDSLPTL
jgi:hypothetical protein